MNVDGPDQPDSMTFVVIDNCEKVTSCY